MLIKMIKFTYFINLVSNKIQKTLWPRLDKQLIYMLIALGLIALELTS